MGQHLGADDHPGAERSGWRAGGLAMLSMGALALPVILFATELANLFIGDEPLTVKYTVQFIYVMGGMMPLLAIEFAIGGALRGAGDTRFPLMATFIGLILVRCGLAAAFTWMELPVAWVYAALVGDYFVKGLMLVTRFKRGPLKTVVRTESMGLNRAVKMRCRRPPRTASIPETARARAVQREFLISVERNRPCGIPLVDAGASFHQGGGQGLSPQFLEAVVEQAPEHQNRMPRPRWRDLLFPLPLARRITGVGGCAPACRCQQRTWRLETSRASGESGCGSDPSGRRSSGRARAGSRV